MFYGYCLLVFLIDAVAAIHCKSSILLIPSLCLFFTFLISFYLFECREKTKTAKGISLAVCVILLICGILGQLAVVVPIGDYLIIAVQALCGMLTVCTDIFSQDVSKQ